MPTRVSRPFCTVFKRTDDEKKLHAMGKELSETQNQLAQAMNTIESMSKEMSAIKNLLANQNKSTEETKP
jgi:hypothetical protein